MTSPVSAGVDTGAVCARITGACLVLAIAAAWGCTRVLAGSDAPSLAAAVTVLAMIGVTSALLFWFVRREIAGLQPGIPSTELADALPQIVWMAGPDGALTHVNAGGVRYSGRTAAHLHGRSWDEDVHPDDRPTLIAERASAIRTGMSRDFEFRLRRADGIYRWHVSRQTPKLAADGTVLAWFGTCTDIEDLKQAERALRDTEARLHEAMRIARLCSWRWEPATDRVWWSDAEFDLFGVDHDVLPSFAAFLALLHPDHRATAIARVEAMRAGADEFADDLLIVREDGTQLWIHSRARATRDAAGALVLVDGTDQDITERRLAEIAAHESESVLTAAVAVAGLGIVVIDYDRQMARLSEEAARQFGLPAATTMPRAELHARFHPDDRAELARRTAEALAPTGPGWFAMEHRVVQPDGRVRWLNVRKQVSFVDGRPSRGVVVTLDVTERRQADARLREQEMLVREAAELAKVGGWGFDPVTLQSDWTPAIARMYGLDPTDPPPLQRALDFYTPEQRPGLEAALAAAIQDGVPHDLELLLKAADGVTRWVRTICRPIVENGRVVRVRGSLQDISDRKQAESALQASEHRYRQLVGVLPTAVLIHDGARVLYCNPAFVRLIGAASADDVQARPLFECVHPDDRPLAHARLAKLLDSGEALPGVELRLRHADGRPVPTYSISTPISGYGPSAFLVALSDLTERERATQLLRTVLGSVSDAIVTIDTRGIVQLANPAAARQFGRPVDELVGRNVGVLMPDADRGRHDGYLAAYLRTGDARVIGIGREVEGQRSDGTRFPAELTVTEFTLDGERHFTGVLRDITARRRLEEQFRQAQKMEAVGRLAAGVAHDFNNLLTVINAYCEMLLAEPLADDDQRESVAAIRDAGERAARLTQQLLAFGRKAMLEPKVIDLNELISESTRLLRRLLGEDVILIVRTAPTPVRVKADPTQLEQVLLNLAVNARDAMPTGGRLTIETSIGAGGDDASRPVARIAVTDTGHGMTDEVRRSIFEPFFTTKAVGKGTGLGLAVVDGAIAQCGGGIAVESAVGHGTTFRIWLPLVTDDRAAHDPTTTTSASRGRETVMVVEDDEAVRGVVRLALTTQGYTVLEADGGAAAVRLAATHPGEIHLLVSDVVMPEMGGRQVLEAIRRRRPGIRALFMSGYTDDAVLRHGVVESAGTFIQKPFTPLGLARKVRQVLDGTDA